MSSCELVGRGTSNTNKRYATGLMALAALAVAVAFPASASAVPEVEPNNGIHQPTGPLQAGVDYDGTISSSNDTTGTSSTSPARECSTSR